jgi:hypothetical protein
MNGGKLDAAEVSRINSLIGDKYGDGVEMAMRE